MRAITIALTACATVAAPPLFAAVTVENITRVKFSGGASVINVFSGKASDEGVPIKISLNDNRQATQTDREIEVIDLLLERIWNYKVNRRGKPGRCRVTTFDERREALAALKDLDFTGGQEPQESDAAPEIPEYEVTITVDETGEEETHANITGNVVKVQILVHRPEMTIEEGGGARVDTTLVVGPKPDGWDETAEWNRRYFEAMDIDAERFEGMAKMLSSTPALKQAMDGLKEKESAFDGAIVRSDLTLFTSPDPRVTEQAQSEEEGGVPTSLGDIGASIGSSLFKRNREEAAAAGPREVFNSSTVLTAFSSEGDDILTLPDRCPQE